MASRSCTVDGFRSIRYATATAAKPRRIRVKMKSEAVLFLFAACYFVGQSIGNDEHSLADEYIEEDLDRLGSFRRFAYSGDSGARRSVNDDELENWTGRWMPDRPNDPTPPPKIFPKNQRNASFESSESIHRVPMGLPSINCDDAKTNLTLDWDGNPINYTCYDATRIVPDKDTIPIKYCERIPKYYVALHKCMYEEIKYKDDVPVFGPHRPLWPVYGEYKFLPKQRWLHNLEHGAVVALYHPCANPLEVKRLNSLLSDCLRRRVITPYNLLDERRPLALVTWGCRLSMSYVDPRVVVRFIREHALRGPENLAKDGNFTENLLRRANVVSDLNDTNLCPNARAF